ncbi:MAG: transporter, partial [Glaciihabitans sp.]|nr:transporter [Glaciihabitans sp.]
AGDGVIIADSGAWTVPHGDHFHYYSAEPHVVGTVKGDGPAVVSSATSRTAIWFGDSGTGIVLDGDDLGAGTITEVGRVSTTPHDGVLVPFGDVLLGSVADGEGDASAVQVYNADGSERSGAPAACAELSGTITTNVGVVFGCADGALLATTAETNGSSEETSGEFATGDSAASNSEAGESATGASIVFERIPYPEATADNDRAVSFDNRAGRPAVAAVAGTGGAWLLDTRARAWTHVATPTPLLLASAVSDNVGHIVAVDTDGRVVVLDPATGTVVAQTEPLVQASISHESSSAGLSLEVDASRAYVNSAAEGVVYEIDYADNARVARTLETGSTPVHFAEIGR